MQVRCFRSKMFCSLKMWFFCFDNFQKSTLFDEHHQTPPLEGLSPSPVLYSVIQKPVLKHEGFWTVLHFRRNASPPEINMATYNVYKNCACITLFLSQIFYSCPKFGSGSVQWCVTSDVYIPKTKPLYQSGIINFRPVALLNVKGKIFFCLASRKVKDHVIKYK